LACKQQNLKQRQQLGADSHWQQHHQQPQQQAGCYSSFHQALCQVQGRRMQQRLVPGGRGSRVLLLMAWHLCGSYLGRQPLLHRLVVKTLLGRWGGHPACQQHQQQQEQQEEQQQQQEEEEQLQQHHQQQ
jgi:hypothetical protein